MSAQRYQRVSGHDDDEHLCSSPTSPSLATSPSARSSPSSSRSQASSSSLNHHSRQSRADPERRRLVSPQASRELDDTFGAPSDDDSDFEDNERGTRKLGLDERQRVMSGRPTYSSVSSSSSPRESGGEHDSHDGVDNSNSRPLVERRVTQIPVFVPPAGGKVYGGGNAVYDGVFANLSAKPERGGEHVDEKPPTYEQAAADATPPYWETTILTPPSHDPSSSDVYIDGLPVGSFFSLIWNGMISMSFQLVGFLLTYLLHTTHAAKNGSKAGLGITLIQYGFSMKRDFSSSTPTPTPPDADTKPSDGHGEGFVQPPGDPNSHDFDPNKTGPDAGKFVADATAHAASSGGMRMTDWLAYALMLVGWFILIRAISEYFKARRHENLVLQSPSRGLNIPVVAEGERPENAV